MNAVLGDAEYNLSPRGWVRFVDRGEESLMLFTEDPEGNARYQLPGDTYLANEKLMDIRRHTRILPNPSPYTIEAPQPQLIREKAAEWAKPRMTLLVDKYLGSAGNTLNPDDVRMLFRPLGYTGPNAADFQEAERLVTDAVFDKMIQKALRAGKKDIVIVTGPPASGKTTAVRELNLKQAGLIYDADLSEESRLENVIRKGMAAGMEEVTVVPVYNDVLTCYMNSINRGKMTWRYTAMDALIRSFHENIGKLEKIRAMFPDVAIRPIDCSHNQGVQSVSLEEALNWNYSVTEKEKHQLFTYLLQQLEHGEIEANSVQAAAGDILSIPTADAANAELARQIQRKVDAILQEYKMR